MGARYDLLRADTASRSLLPGRPNHYCLSRAGGCGDQLRTGQRPLIGHCALARLPEHRFAQLTPHRPTILWVVSILMS